MSLSIGLVTLDAQVDTGHAREGFGGPTGAWWLQYVQRHAFEKAATPERDAREGIAHATVPALSAHGVGSVDIAAGTGRAVALMPNGRAAAFFSNDEAAIEALIPWVEWLLAA